jgi:hypothetical protein
MRNRLFLCGIFCLSAVTFAGSQTKDANAYQGITVPASYAYHLAGRTDRIHGYVVKIEDASKVSNPGLVFLASGIDQNEGTVDVNGNIYALPALTGDLSRQSDKSEKNAEGKEGWYSFSSGDDIIGKIVIPFGKDILKNGLNDVTFYKNSGTDGFEIIDARIQPVSGATPAVVGQTYHLLARGKPSSIGDFDYVFNYKGGKKRHEKEIPDWRRRGKVVFYRAGVDWDHLDRMFEMFKEARVNDAAVGIPADSSGAEFRRVKSFIDRCHAAGIKVTAFNSLGNISFRDYLMRPELEKWISRDEYGALRWRGEKGGGYAADLQNEDYRRNSLLKHAALQMDAGADELYYDWAIGGTGDVLEFFTEVRRLAKEKGVNISIFGNCKGNILADEVCDETKSEGTTEAGIWDGKWVHNVAQARFYYASGDGVKPYESKYEGADPGVPNPGARDVREGMKYGWKKPIAEASAFQSHFAIAEAGDKMLDGWVHKNNPLAMEVWGNISRYMAFLSDHQELYTNVSCVSKVGVVAPPHIPSFEVSLTRESLYNALVEMNIMYDVLLLHRLTPEALAPYKAIIIPDISWVEEKQLAAVQAYKKSGGKIYTIGSAPELRDLATSLSPAELFAGLGDSPAREELRARMASLEGEPLITLTGAPYVAANVVRKNGTDRFILHFVNYDKPLQDVRVRLNLEGMPVKINRKKVQCWSPDLTAPLQVSQIAVKGRTLEFTLPALDVYDVVTVN